MARTSRMKKTTDDACVEVFNMLTSMFGGNYPHPFNEPSYDCAGCGDLARTVVELRMCALSAVIRDKPDWHIKMQDPVIRAKWREEALAQALPEGMRVEWKLTEGMIDYVLDELDGYAKLRDDATGIQVSCYERVWQSDNLIASGLLDRLLKSVAKLEHVPADKQDWHPGSDGLVLDLVHPSLYPVRYGLTVARTAADSYKTIDIPADVKGDPAFLSKRFQWLPSDFAIDANGKAHLQGYYINNIHPSSNADLYPVVEELVERAVPMFERVLSDLHRPLTKQRMKVEQGEDVYSHYQNKVGCVFADEHGRSTGQPDNEDPEGFYEWDEDQQEAWRLSNVTRLPEVVGKYEGALDKITQTVSLTGCTIQVIVKLANIVLTPEKSLYTGGSWHVEGMLNEEIVSTFIYYYDEDNITESRLNFRTGIAEPTYHGQDDETCSQILYHMNRSSTLSQELGGVRTSHGRCIAFPNVYQHQVQPFELKDKTKPGHRKIVALFLVNPDRKVPSTTDVPPQQQDWIDEAIHDSLDRKLPVELLSLISGMATGTMSRAEAEAVREELMKERSRMVLDHNEQKFNVEFNMCEH